MSLGKIWKSNFTSVRKGDTIELDLTIRYFALKLLKVFTPTINATSFDPHGKPGERSTYKSGFYEANYEAIKEVADVNLINDSLIAKYGSHPHETGPSIISDRDPIDDETLVSVFQWFIEND